MAKSTIYKKVWTPPHKDPSRHKRVAQARLEFGTFHFEKVLLDDELGTYQSENHYSILNFQMEKLGKSLIFELFLSFRKI